jgi:Skp family chaperone for outer membrane proteins
MRLNGFRFLIVTAFMALCVCSASAQPKPATTPTPAPPAQTQSVVSIPTSKMALIYSEAFQDPKAGIARFVASMDRLNNEFKDTQKQLSDMEQKMAQLQDEITKAQAAASVVDPRSVQAKSGQLEQLKRDYQRKGEDAQAAYNKRRDEIFKPLQEDLGKALEAYAKAHGITVIIDASQVPLIMVDSSIDITRAFIADYNSKNPVTASVAAPK